MLLENNALGPLYEIESEKGQAGHHPNEGANAQPRQYVLKESLRGSMLKKWKKRLG